MEAHRERAETLSAVAVALKPDGFSRTTRPRRPVANRTILCRVNKIIYTRERFLFDNNNKNNKKNNYCYYFIHICVSRVITFIVIAYESHAYFRRVIGMESIYPRRVPVMGNLTGNGWTVASQESVLSLIVVLGSSVSLVGLIFAFITYR